MSLQPIRTLQALEQLPHREYDRASLILAAGRREMGKTFLLTHYIENREPRVFIFDPFDDFAAIRRRLDPAEALAEMNAQFPGAIRRRVVPPIGDESRAYADYWFNQMIDGETPLRNCLLVLDEITLWSASIETQALRTLVLQGRRLGIKLAVAVQRIALTPGVILSECTELCLFRTSRPRDLETVRDWAGQDAAKIAPKLNQGELLLLTL